MPQSLYPQPEVELTILQPMKYLLRPLSTMERSTVDNIIESELVRRSTLTDAEREAEDKAAATKAREATRRLGLECSLRSVNSLLSPPTLPAELLNSVAAMSSIRIAMSGFTEIASWSAKLRPAINFMAQMKQAQLLTESMMATTKSYQLVDINRELMRPFDELSEAVRFSATRTVTSQTRIIVAAIDDVVLASNLAHEQEIRQGQAMLQRHDETNDILRQQLSEEQQARKASEADARKSRADSIVATVFAIVAIGIAVLTWLLPRT